VGQNFNNRKGALKNARRSKTGGIGNGRCELKKLGASTKKKKNKTINRSSPNSMTFATKNENQPTDTGPTLRHEDPARVTNRRKEDELDLLLLENFTLGIKGQEEGRGNSLGDNQTSLLHNKRKREMTKGVPLKTPGGKGGSTVKGSVSYLRVTLVGTGGNVINKTGRVCNL